MEHKDTTGLIALFISPFFSPHKQTSAVYTSSVSHVWPEEFDVSKKADITLNLLRLTSKLFDPDCDLHFFERMTTFIFTPVRVNVLYMQTSIPVVLD